MQINDSLLGTIDTSQNNPIKKIKCTKRYKEWLDDFTGVPKGAFIETHRVIGSPDRNRLSFFIISSILVNEWLFFRLQIFASG